MPFPPSGKPNINIKGNHHEQSIRGFQSCFLQPRPRVFKRLQQQPNKIRRRKASGHYRHAQPGARRPVYKLKPDVRAQVTKAEGYAVFSNANINLIFASVGAGHGVVHDNKSGKNTFMKMGEAGIGLGLGVKDFRAVFVFHSRDALTQFVEDGWAFGVNADAAAKASEKGAAVGGEATFDNITVYQLTESGFALQATVKGTKFWQDSELN